MKLIDRIIFWVVLTLVFVACSQSVLGFFLFLGLMIIFHRGIIEFYKGNWYQIK